MRILAFAYACEPDKGSEPSAGWMWSRILATLGETTVITRANNRPSIERVLSSLPDRDRLRFVYVDLPRRVRFWKKGPRGARFYYFLWQLRALREARRLNEKHRFDLIWHLTLANAWIGSVGGRVGPRFIYGPVGGGVRFPWRLVRAVGFSGAVYELFRAGAQIAGRYLNPLARSAWRRAELVLVQNAETREWLPKNMRSKSMILPNAILDASLDGSEVAREPQTAIFAGRLQPLKGVALAIEAIARTTDWSIWICGDGRDMKRLRRIARRLGIEGRVIFLGQRSRNEVLSLMHRAKVLLFPSLHEEAGLVVLEGLAAGLRPICLERGGPPTLAGIHGITISIGSYGDVVNELGASLVSLPGQSIGLAGYLANFSMEAVAGRLRRALVLDFDSQQRSPGHL